MPPMPMDLVYLVYALSLLAMAVAVAARIHKASSLEFGRSLWMFAGFAFLHSGKELVEMWKVVHGSSAFLDALSPILLGSSFVLLAEFGRRMTSMSMHLPKWLRFFVGPWPVPAAAFLCLAWVLLADRVQDAGENMPRYLLGFPGAALTAFGFHYYGRTRLSKAVDSASATATARAFTVAASAFASYAVFAGLFVTEDPLFPASVINNEAFQEVFGVPIQFARAACVCVALVGVMRLMDVFRIEREIRIERAQNRFRAIADAVEDAVVELDAAGRVAFWSKGAERMFGHPAKEAVGRPIVALTIPARLREDYESTLRRFAAGEPEPFRESVVETMRMRADGTEFPAEINVGALEGYDGVHVVAVVRDCTPKRASERLRRLGAKVIESVLDGIVVTDASSKIELVNPSFSRITGWSQDEIVGKTPAVLNSGRHPPEFYAEMWRRLDETGAWQGEIWNRRKNGEIYPEWLSLVAVRDLRGNVEQYVGLFSDITRRKELEERLERMAYHDALTGLPNRSLFYERLGQELRDVRRYGGFLVAVLYLDLDFFKKVNDENGHDIGDGLLKQVASRLLALVREADTVARMGGDEFAIVLTHVVDLACAESVAAKIVAKLTEPFDVEGRICRIGTSVGVSIAPENGLDGDELVAMADSAMYTAKSGGKGRYAFAPSKPAA